MFPLVKGRVTKQAHVGLPEGTFEEEHGREAFDGRSSHLYRSHPPTAWVRIDGPLKPRAYDLNGLKPSDLTDSYGEWQRILSNEDVSIYVSKRSEPMPYYLRDSDGDVCYFVHRGAGVLETDYGPLRYEEGDFLVLPKGTAHRLVPDPQGLVAPGFRVRARKESQGSTWNFQVTRVSEDGVVYGRRDRFTNHPKLGKGRGRYTLEGTESALADVVPMTTASPPEGTLRKRADEFLAAHSVREPEDNFFYVIEGRGEYRLPDRGILGKHALFDPGVLETPEPEPHDEEGEFEVRVKRDDDYTTLVYRWHPLDVVGWKGDLCPVRFNKRDFRPVVSPRYHVPPSVHVMWKSDGFEIGLFAPRPTETGDPTALRVPFFHSNIDKDEVLFYHQGQFFSRAGIGEAFITHHPQGLQHGPQAAAIEASKTKEFADEYAVMVEADRPFERDDALEPVEIEGYATSWARGMGLID